MSAGVFELGSDPYMDEGALSAGHESAALPAALLRKCYALCVSTIEVRKNHRTLYHAWDECIRSKRVDSERDRLVFLGRRGWGVDDLLREIENNPATRGTIIIIDNADDNVLDAVYRNCAFAVLPSYYEGYGLPLAEALRYCVPCLTSDRGSLSEVGGNLVLRLDPNDTPGWAREISRLLRSPDELVGWTERIRTQHVPMTWDRSAQQFYSAVKAGARSQS